jgi:hypothetical protein
MLAVLMTAASSVGYSNSHDTKQMLTYQVDQNDHEFSLATLKVAFAPAEVVESVRLVRVDLGQKKPFAVRLKEKSEKGYANVIRPPPDRNTSKITIN